ncbi:hypothetical protein GY45DRAFT_1167352 [Cubamyces sp. BRFM 1775]|nr:hypothetical protein GY45DRAFT_1167352 [Cubamyces sp. BRFM 1775]
MILLLLLLALLPLPLHDPRALPAHPPLHTLARRARRARLALSVHHLRPPSHSLAYDFPVLLHSPQYLCKHLQYFLSDGLVLPVPPHPPPLSSIVLIGSLLVPAVVFSPFPGTAHTQLHRREERVPQPVPGGLAEDRCSSSLASTMCNVQYGTNAAPSSKNQNIPLNHKHE